MKLFLCLLVSLALIFSPGCASVGNNFDNSQITEIKKGETTEADLVRMFGEPQSRSINSENSVTLSWMYMESVVKGESFIPYAGAFVGGSRSKMKTLTVTLDNGLVTTYAYSGGGSESRGMTQRDPKKETQTAQETK